MNSTLLAGYRMRRHIILVMLILCTILIGVSLYSPELIGVSDNGDFNRIMQPNRIAYVTGQREPFVFESRYRVTLEGESDAEKLYNLLFTLDKPYFTTQNLFIKPSLLLNLISNILTGADAGDYTIFWLGLIYFASTLGALTIIFVQFRTERMTFNLLFYLLFMVMFCDIAYTAYFHSFFGEPVQFVALLWIIASVMGVIRSEKRKLVFVILFFVSVILFSGAKFANIPQGILFAFSGLTFMIYFQGKKISKGIILALLSLTLLFCYISYQNVPNWMDNHTTYQSVFFGILKGSPAPEKDLVQLGLPKELSILANTNAYMSGHKMDIGSDEFKRQFYDRISKTDILKFYVKNPLRLLDKLRISSLDSAHIRPIYLSNYGNNYERLKFKYDVGLWSNFRLTLPFDSITFTGLLFLVSGALVLYESISMSRRKKDKKDTIIMLVFFTTLLIINAMNLIIPVLANGEADLAKHMFAYTMGLDLQVLFLVFWLLWKVLSKGIRFTLRVSGIIPVLIFILLLVFQKSPLSNINTTFTAGSYVYFGQRQDKPILWRVLQSEGSRIKLLADQPVSYAAFDDAGGEGDSNRIKYGSNFWPDSEIREWLNKDFITCFSPSELDFVQENKHWVILSIADKSKAQRGDDQLFWTHLPTQANFDADNAYSLSVMDKVFLLNINDFSKHVAGQALEQRPKQSYWLETPYYNNSSMVRVVGEDGYVYMKDANFTEIGVRPCVIIDGGTVLQGTGKRDQPYVFGRSQGTVLQTPLQVESEEPSPDS